MPALLNMQLQYTQLLRVRKQMETQSTCLTETSKDSQMQDNITLRQLDAKCTKSCLLLLLWTQSSFCLSLQSEGSCIDALQGVIPAVQYVITEWN